VLAKLVRTVTQIKVAIISYYPPIKIFRISCRKFLLQWSLIIQNNNVVWFCVTPRRIAYYPRGVVDPQFGNHWYRNCKNVVAKNNASQESFVSVRTFVIGLLYLLASVTLDDPMIGYFWWYQTSLLGKLLVHYTAKVRVLLLFEMASLHSHWH